MKIMKPNQTARRTRTRFPGIAENRRVSLGLVAVRSLAVCAIIAQCLTPAWAADALPAQEPETRTTPVQAPAETPKGYRMERYKAFARQAEMPAITVADKTTIEVGDAVKTDLNRLARLSNQEKVALASQFGVPAGVIDKVAEGAAKAPSPGAARFVQDLRTAVIDYRFLQGEWERYNPPAEGRKIKADALQALQGGDVGKAWELYDELQPPPAPSIARPAPPANLRIVSQ